MPGGRPRKPDARKILEGDRPDRINRNAPKPSPDVGPVPHQIEDDPVAVRCWVRLVRLLAPTKVLSSVDSDQLAIYCVNFSLWLKAREEVEEKGLLVATLTSWKANPALAVVRACETQMGRILGQFGMTPAARSALDLGADDEGDGFDQWLAEGEAPRKPENGPAKAIRRPKDAEKAPG